MPGGGATSPAIFAGVAPPPPRSAGYLAVGILLILYALSVLDRQILALLVEDIKQDLTLTDVEFSALQGIAFALFYGLFALPIGWLVDKWSRRWIIYLGVTCWSIATAACGAAQNFSQLFAARAAVGAGEASLAPAGQSILADMFPPDRLSFAMTMFTLGAGIGTGLAFFLGGPLVELVRGWGTLSLPLLGDLAPWRTVMMLVGLPGILIALAIFLLPEPRRRTIVAPGDAGAANAGGFMRFVRTNRTFLLLHHGGFGLLQLALIGMQLWMPAYMSRSFGWAVGETGVWMGAIMIVTAIIGLPMHGALVDRLFRKGTLDAHMSWYGRICLITAPVALLAFTSGTAIVSLAGFAVVYLLLLGGPGIGSASLQIVAPGHLRGKLAATYMLVTGLIGGAAGPMAIAMMTDLVLQDEARLGVSIAVVAGGAAALSGLMLLAGRGAMVRCAQNIRRTDAGTGL